RHMKITRLLIMLFIVLLTLSGVTAFPLKTEVSWIMDSISFWPPAWQGWILAVSEAVHESPELMFYGTDWLAFAHLVIALFFIPVYCNPTRYKANLIAGMLACIGVLPLAFICGPLRGIPFFHQLVDCAFGVLGFILL